jgi:hypothetical protein
VARLKAAMTTLDANMLRRVVENAMQFTVVCLEMEKGRFEQML